MDDNRLLRQYSRSNNFWTALVYNFLTADIYFRSFFNFGPYCGVITVVTCLLVVCLLTYTAISWSTFITNSKKFNELCDKSEKKLPRKESVLQVRPAYNCINKHLQQVDVFLDKTKKVITKEQLEVEILNSRINSITELLNPTDQLGWSRSRTPKSYFREQTPMKRIVA